MAAKRGESALEYSEEGFFYPPVPRRRPLSTRAAPLSPVKPKVDLKVPHIHQLWDIPDGFKGHWACGPTSMAMVLAFYGVLPKKPTQVTRPHPHSSDYGWYIPNEFSLLGTSFSKKAGAPGNRMMAGLYGTALGLFGGNWVTGADGLATITRALLAPSGRTMQLVTQPKIEPGSIFMKRKPFEQKVQATLDSGHPVIVSGRYFWKPDTPYDHIVVIRGYYPDPGTGELKWLVNDPFGFKTAGTFDGGGVVYRFDEINPKWMCRFGGTLAQTPDAEGRKQKAESRKQKAEG